MLRDQPDHLVVVFVLLVHVDRKVGLLHHDVKLLSFLELSLRLQTLPLVDIQRVDRGLAHERDRNLVHFLPLLDAHVHVDSVLGASGFDVVLLCIFIVLGRLEVLCDDLEESTRHVIVLGLNNLDSLRPLPSLNRRLDRLDVLPCLDEVVDGSIQLLLRHQPVAPLKLQLHHLSRKVPPRKFDCLPVSVPLAVGLQRAFDHVELLKEVSSLLMQARLAQGSSDRLQHLRGLSVLLALHQSSRADRKSSLQVELDSRLDVSLLLLQLRRHLLLPRHQEPLQVRGLELLSLRLALALRDGDRLVPSVQLLVHLHRFLHLPLLQQDLLCSLELLLELRHLRLDPVVLGPVRQPGHLCFIRDLVHLAQVHGLGCVSQSRTAPLGNEEAVVLQRELTEGGPHRLGLRAELKLLQQCDSFLVLLVLDRAPKLYQRLVKTVGDRVDTLVDDHLSPAPRPLNVFHVSLDLEDGDSLRSIDGVPDTQVVTILSHHHITVWNPLHVAAEVEEGRSGLRQKIKQVQLAMLVSVQKLRCRRVQLEPVNFGIMVHGSYSVTRRQIKDADRLKVHQVCNLLVLLLSALISE
mmetsp:Transcript_24048/g.53970  ORF Transcript_24048/g.53970 Transcript_24048/m.53970 type:complete len:577 (-) Transcript_24048:1388-3118(-)